MREHICLPLPRGFLGLAANLAIGIILSRSIYTTLLPVRKMSITIIVRKMVFILLPLEQLAQSNRDFLSNHSQTTAGVPHKLMVSLCLSLKSKVASIREKTRHSLAQSTCPRPRSNSSSSTQAATLSSKSHLTSVGLSFLRCKMGKPCQWTTAKIRRKYQVVFGATVTGTQRLFHLTYMVVLWYTEDGTASPLEIHYVHQMGPPNFKPTQQLAI